MKRRKGGLGRSGCTDVVFRRAHKGGRILPSSQWKVITRCAGKSLKKSAAAKKPARRGPARVQCRRGGQYWNERMKAQIRAGRKPTAQLFTSCK